MKKILMVNGSYNEIPLIEAAHRLGWHVITSGNDPSGEGHKYSDKYCPCDYSDKEAILNIAQEEKVDAICSCGNDFGAISAAYACEKLGLPGHDTYENSLRFHEKHKFKEMAEEMNLPTPKAKTFADLQEALLYMEECRYPVIVKPTDLGGGKGISIARNTSEGIKAVKLAYDKSKVKNIVVEDYLEGTQHGFTCFLYKGKVVLEYTTNDYSYINPYMVWIASGHPADGYNSVRAQIVGDVERMAGEYALEDGFLTIQYMMVDGKPYYLETMRRHLGNHHYLCMSKDCGVDLDEVFVANEMGLDVSAYVSQMSLGDKTSGFMGIYGNRNGVVESIEFDEEFKTKIFEEKMLIEEGYEIKDYLGDKLGMVYYSFKDKDERDRFMDRKEELFKVLYKED